MKKSLLPLLLSATPLLAGSPAPAPAPQAASEQGWTLGLETLSMRAFQGNNSFSDENYDFAGRVAVGYQFNNDLFTKLTAFGFSPGGDDKSFTGYSDDLGGTAAFQQAFNMKAAYIDWTVGRNFKPSAELTLSPSLGLRWAYFDENYREHVDDGMGGIHIHHEQVKYDGLGLVAGVDGTRALGNGFSLYGTLKASLLYGQNDYSRNEGMVMSGMPPDISHASHGDDHWVTITELGIGAQYDFSFYQIAASVRAGFEGQLWTGMGNSQSEMSLNSSNEFAGFVLGANFRF